MGLHPPEMQRKGFRSAGVCITGDLKVKNTLHTPPDFLVVKLDIIEPLGFLFVLGTTF